MAARSRSALLACGVLRALGTCALVVRSVGRSPSPLRPAGTYPPLVLGVIFFASRHHGSHGSPGLGAHVAVCLTRFSGRESGRRRLCADIEEHSISSASGSAIHKCTGCSAIPGRLCRVEAILGCGRLGTCMSASMRLPSSAESWGGRRFCVDWKCLFDDLSGAGFVQLCYRFAHDTHASWVHGSPNISAEFVVASERREYSERH